jgi:NADH-quinone oxidoreductase subunit C
MPSPTPSNDIQSHPDAAALVAVNPAYLSDVKFDRGELTLTVPAEHVVAVGQILKSQQEYIRLSTVTGVDWYPAEPRFEVVYHLLSLSRNTRLRVKCKLPGTTPEIDSLTGVWRSANWYERETFDLFGIHFRNHPDLTRIMLPEDWEGHPLRKDCPVTGTRV